MPRDKIVSEVTRVLHGPIKGNGEELDNNPLDFYSVGVLFPQMPFTIEYEEQDGGSKREIWDTIGKKPWNEDHTGGKNIDMTGWFYVQSVMTK